MAGKADSPYNAPFVISEQRKCGRCSALFGSTGEAICQRCRDYMARWRPANKDKKARHDRTYEAKHRDKVNKRFRDRWASERGRKLRQAALLRWKIKIRSEMVAAYGGACNCCGETELAFLTLEHIGGGGGKHRREVGGQGKILTQLRRQGWPKDKYTVLCMNCNHAKKDGKPCPHEVVRIRLLS